ncbi:MAG: ABC transporter substrate-binding protein [Magnetococcales bacterium]|nr:ABC transporter substrate-binding protein [Magnetococcales bacterium]
MTNKKFVISSDGGPEPIRVGYGYYVASGKREFFENGVLMAVNEVNQSPQAVFKGRKLEPVLVDLPLTANPKEMWPIARKIAEQNLVATVLSAGGGGENANIGSAIFEKHRIVNLWPFTTTTKLTQHNFKYVFRNTPNNDVQAKLMASVCAEAPCKHVGIVYVRSSSGEELAAHLETHLNHIDETRVVFYQSIYPRQKDFFPIVTRLLAKHQVTPLDAVYFSGTTGEAVPFINLLREFKLDIPVVLGVSMNDPKLLERDAKGKSQAVGSIVVGIFDETEPENAQFIKDYDKVYKKKAKSYGPAAQGYDSIMLLVEAMRYSSSADPDNMVSYLRYGGALASQGKKRPRRHSINGEILKDDFFLQIVRERQKSDGKPSYYFDKYNSNDVCVFRQGVTCLTQQEPGSAN